ncbi:penicillin binding protein 1C, peptidoglycan biosynthesis [Legionella beliardensis]|uniref:peptidoglycan glycosyltransferase n=1 Tax=Legionella beliardensis TaxID=91822 RepID=A0A378I0T2_9GAMM|nr:penicillin-binding protein 1C [Legionella beliardensis]STX28798.1 penicillin binding protein 1C, peptidoglycan biosynthesis [Legionella beliardensis]
MKIFFTSLILAALIFLTASWVILSFSPPPPLLEKLNFSTVVYDDHKQLLRLTLNNDDKYRVYTPLKKISPHLVTATLLQEDQYFYNHYGVNPFAIIKATWQTYLIKSRRMGASTITMQVARLRFGINSKTLSGKFMQIIRALQLEMHYSKTQILEAYLNLAPYGGNIEGAGAASLIYFNKPIANINLPEALTLAVMPQNPNKRTPQNKDLKKIRNKLFARWLALHPEDRKQKITIDLPLAMKSVASLPFIAPHFVNSILHQARLGKEINTTLDSHLQTILERITKNYIKRKHHIGVYNASVLLVDTRDMSIKSLIGSVDFFNNAISGQINGTEIKRSPGSTLKPFVYGLALDQGLIHPSTVLKDVPRSFGNYNPENFDYDFMGPLKARDALILSRNIPAIYLASQLTNPSLYDLLSAAHVQQLKSESFYGLALTLGGAELSMQELASLYAMLVNEGLWHPLRKLQNDPKQTGKRLLSPEASFLVLDMLKDTPQADFNFTKNTANQDMIAWKTGTSSGYRDAWTAGVFGPYVLITWIGNFDNKGNPAFVGKNIAAPLFFELASAIKHEKTNLPSTFSNALPHLNLVKTDVCKASGLLPTRFCHDTEKTWFIPGKSPIQTDTIYREIAINKQNGLRTCHFDENTRFEVYEFWPSDLLAIFKQAGIERRTPPVFEPGCALKAAGGLKPQITSPQIDLHYILRANTLEKTTIPFSAVTDADIKTLYWFINDSFLTKTRADESYFWQAKPGKFIVRVVDDHGFSDARTITIEVDA